MHTAEYWHRTEDGKVQCELCPHRCLLNEGRTGLCRVRMARAGQLEALSYGLISSAALDPIEKKPLYHFRPGSHIFSVGGWGCNFACSFCQNWTISQAVETGSRTYSPDQLAAHAADGGSVGVAYTYNEPFVAFEFVRDCSRFVREAGLVNVLVTNGYVETAPAAEILPLVDALNIDIKSMDDAFYREQCRGRLQPVLELAEQAVNAGCHVEVTNLVIPGLNDSDDLLLSLARWIAGSLGRSVPLHLSAYRPQHKLTVAATPAAMLLKAYELCRNELDHVYVGNVMTGQGQNTYCPGCNSPLVLRRGYSVEISGLDGGNCSSCGLKADIIMA